MAEPFDPYRVWLGIPSADRPVNHYRLLGIELFENDPEVIDNAADRQMLLLRTFQIGKYSDLSQKLLNEVATAKVCLLRPEKKAVYDEQLRQQFQAKSEGSVSQRPEIDSGLARALELEARKGRSQARQGSKPGLGLILGAAGAVGILVVILVVWAATRKAPPAAQPVAVAPERDSRNVVFAGASGTPQPPPASRRAVAPEADKESRRHKEAEGSPNSSATRVPTGTSGAAEAPVSKGPNAPPLAIAPFDAEKAKQHQEDWAKYLGVPVKETNSIGMPLVFIPPGEFDMGSTMEESAWALEQCKKSKEQWNVNIVRSEAPQHRVKITTPFYLGMYSVTQGEYEKVMAINPSAFAARQVAFSTFKPSLMDWLKVARENDLKKMIGRDTSRHPVDTVNWHEATEFCRRLSAMPAEQAAKRLYRLPTEAEWEYACRAGTATRWYCGNDETGLLECAWFGENSSFMTHPAGQKRPNAWGLFDMHGDVGQWYVERVARGGHCYGGAPICRSACRDCLSPFIRTLVVGFRSGGRGT